VVLADGRLSSIRTKTSFSTSAISAIFGKYACCRVVLADGRLSSIRNTYQDFIQHLRDIRDIWYVCLLSRGARRWIGCPVSQQSARANGFRMQSFQHVFERAYGRTPDVGVSKCPVGPDCDWPTMNIQSCVPLPFRSRPMRFACGPSNPSTRMRSHVRPRMTSNQ
jgi:hypothetical protein